MLQLDETRLNKTERTTLRTLSDYAQEHPAPTIVEAAVICECSVSHVSKAVRKAGFPGYKQYIRYLYFRDGPQRTSLDELRRLRSFLDEFDFEVMEEFARLIGNHRKIILFGYGPSLICAQYVEYKLRFCTPAHVTTAPDEHSVRSLVDNESLLVILTATGRYRAFDDICRLAIDRGSEVVVVSEEYNPALAGLCGRYIFLTEHHQPGSLEPHEKTRTVFFIFFEQVVQRILRERKRRVP